MKRRAKYKAKEKSSPNWLELPRDIALSIIGRLDAVEILGSVQRVCTQWRSIYKDPSLWRTIVFINVHLPTIKNLQKCAQNARILNSMLRQAVDRSCGGLIDLDLTACGGGDFLDYLTKRCTQIRRLRLVKGCVSEARLCEAAKRLPLLEDLEISFNSKRVTAKALHKFGECCPLLKSLKLNRLGVALYRPKDDRDALAIAANMLALRHLQLFGNGLTNYGLKAILDNCSHLESLDLRFCLRLDLEHSSLRKQCEGIKDFWGPYDSTNDCEYSAEISSEDVLARRVSIMSKSGIV